MTAKTILTQIALGEDSSHQFTVDVSNGESLAAEMMVDQFHADELPTKAGIDKLDKLRFRDFLRDVYKQALPEAPAELTLLLQNMNLPSDDCNLNLPYHGLGSGIKRALALWPQIDFSDDREGCLFVATVHRHAPANAPTSANA